MRLCKHPSRDALAKRLKRVEGHLRATLTMLEGKRRCADLAQQLQAIEAAVAAAKRQLVHDQIQHCLQRGTVSGSTLGDLRQLAKYL